MKNYKSPQVYIKESGEKIKLYRISLSMTQQELADASGVSIRSISRLEQGESVQLDTFIKILTALNLDENINLLIPDQTKRPSYYLSKIPRQQQRVRKKTDKKSRFVWGDEA